MALRMVNGHFTQFNILQYNTNLVDRDSNHDKVVVDSWFVPNSSQRDELLKNYKLPPFSKAFQDFTVGSIVSKPDDI